MYITTAIHVYVVHACGDTFHHTASHGTSEVRHLITSRMPSSTCAVSDLICGSGVALQSWSELCNVGSNLLNHHPPTYIEGHSENNMRLIQVPWRMNSTKVQNPRQNS